MAIPPKLLKAATPSKRHNLRGPGGKFISKANYAKLTRGTSKTQRKENWLRNKWGAPPAGQTWMKIASKYPEKFEPYLDELQGIG